MSIDSNRFVELAQRWQEKHPRKMKSAVAKLAEELGEFYDSNNYSEELDEVGDVIVTAMRLLVCLTPEELECAYQIAKMKADRRLVEPKTKDKEEELRLRNEILKQLG